MNTERTDLHTALVPDDATIELIPDFDLPASTGKDLGLESFRGKVNMAMVFIDLADDSDIEVLRAIDSRLKDFGEQRSQILPIVRANASEVRRIADEHELAVPLLADESGETERSLTDRPSPSGVAVVADKDGTIVKRIAFAELGPHDLVDELLETVTGLHRTDIGADGTGSEAAGTD